MKTLFLFFMIALSSVSFAGEIQPILVTNEGLPVIACHFIKVSSKDVASEAVVFRANKALLPFWFDSGREGTMIALNGEKTATSRGVTGMYMINEGTTMLPGYSDEKWTHESPAGTFFTSRGNFVGFFMMQSEVHMPVAKLVKNEFTYLDEMNMTCSDDLEVVKGWVKSVLSYNPL